MPLQSSGAISLQDLQDEFGGSHPITINEYGPLRTSGSGTTVALSDYYGATNTPVVTQGTLSQQFSTIYGFNDANSVGSVSPAGWLNDSGELRTIKEIARVQASAGLFFQFELSYSSSNSIPANEFTSIQFTANGTLTTLTSSEASTTTTQGGFGRRWSWSLSNGLDTTEISNIASEFDGSGNVTITVNN